MKVKQVVTILKNLSGQQINEICYNLFCRPKTFPKWKNKTLQQKSLSDKAVIYEAKGEFCDHMEMSGTYASAIISYGADEKNRMRIFRHVTFPFIRLMPDMTTSSVCHNYLSAPEILVDGVEVKDEVFEKVSLKGNLELTSNFKDGLQITRTEIICKDFPALIEKTTITNITKTKINLTIFDNVKTRTISAKKCKNGKVTFAAGICGEHGSFSYGKEKKLETNLVPNASFTYYVVYCALLGDNGLEIKINEQVKKRDNFVNNAMTVMTLKTPDEHINALYSHSLIRGAESVFLTQKGLLHSPGGGKYYAAIWANDQMEYAAPVVPFIGNKELSEATKNAINLYVNYMDTSGIPFDKKRALPSSIINGTYPFGIAGDRGDTAMVGLGIAQFALNLNDIEYAKEYLWAVEWCIEFCESRKSEKGVIFSDSDELEGRFPSGDYNLSTNINYYLLLKYAAILERELGSADKAERYEAIREELRKSIKEYFEAEVEGYDTYRYYENNKVLRSWICLPLIAGINDRKEGTIKALTERLYKDGRMFTASNKNIVWDRSLLFALRGMFISGEGITSLKYLSDYSAARLTGPHSPYPYEAYPEGNGAQLSAESLLYTRIIIEGMFGISVEGFNKFAVEPRLPLEENYKLNKIILGGVSCDIEYEKGLITVNAAGKTYSGTSRLEFSL